MYEARQNKEKVNRTISGSGMVRQRVKIEGGKFINVVQRTPLTRSQLNIIVDEMIASSNDTLALEYLQQIESTFLDKSLIQDEYLARTQRDIDFDSPQLGELLHEYGHIEDYGVGNIEYTGEELLAQFKRASNRQSAEKDFNTSNVGWYEKVSYTTDSKGGIDFRTPTTRLKWNNPVNENSEVDLSEGKGSDFPLNKVPTDYGMLGNGKYVQIRGANRSQHFNIANRLTGSSGSESPKYWTWHHLLEYPKMVLVDRIVHRKYGHNGGFYLW